MKVKNLAAIPLRAAYLRGPYTLYAACYPSTFDPHHKQEDYEKEGPPTYEPNLKAGGHWTTRLTVPEEIRQAAGGPRSRQSLDGNSRSCTWIIEIASQILFSTTASVSFELLVGRDEKSIDLGFHTATIGSHSAPGSLEDHQQGRNHAAQPKGVFSKAVKVRVDDTASLWNTPPFPGWDKDGRATEEETHAIKVKAKVKDGASEEKKEAGKKQKIHLVVLTHGLHSNTGADMLYLKESIDAAARQAKEDVRKKRAELKKQDEQAKGGNIETDVGRHRSSSLPNVSTNQAEEPAEESDDDEQVIVRGFMGNAVKTEKGVNYLGKRLAKYVLSITYPDQPFLPVKSSISQKITRSFTGDNVEGDAKPAHPGSKIVRDEAHTHGDLAYKITSISFIAHSLGGLTQMYAIAYIMKHSPEFFDYIKPINFIAMASPFLGLSNENPMYVKFALDFGLVGRTGQDLGLTWRAPTIAKSSWTTIVGGRSTDVDKEKEPDPTAKPLLRILPTGPAHEALKKFRNRSVYSNVVNDGIVPLRTSCLLFLDWRGLSRVEKARRENGLVGTMIEWGWNEFIGQNASSPKQKRFWDDMFADSDREPDKKSLPPAISRTGSVMDVPQESASAGLDAVVQSGQFLNSHKQYRDEGYDQEEASKTTTKQQPGSVWSGLMSWFKPQGGSSKPHHPTPKHQKIYSRGQTMGVDADHQLSQDGATEDAETNHKTSTSSRNGLVRGSSAYSQNSRENTMTAPPKTTFFESAGDLLNPPLPPKDFILDPAARPRTIFHDRIYHPNDIPAPPVTKRQKLQKLNDNHRTQLSSSPTPTSPTSSSRRSSLIAPAHTSTSRRHSSSPSLDASEVGTMKIEEKIARAYHKDLSWRKVLVRLEPDAHNNMIVRRMFANAYGWPVVKHLCDTHFAYTEAAETADADEVGVERAFRAEEEAKGKEDDEEVRGQTDSPSDELVREKSQGEHGNANAARHQRPSKAQTFPIPNPNLNPIARTDSETIEAHDFVGAIPDDVARANTVSGAASKPPGPQRQESAEWSDRLFEDDEDDEDSDVELSSAHLATARLVDEPRRLSGSSQGSARNVAGARVAPNTVLMESPRQTLDVPRSGEKSGGKDKIPLRPKDESRPSQLGLASLGLRKSLDGQVGDDRGVMEQVAVAQGRKGGDEA